VIAGHRRLAAAIAAGLREVPCIVHNVDDEGAQRIRAAANLGTPVPDPVRTVADACVPVDADLSTSIATASSLADLLAGPLSDLSRGAIGTLLKAELWRASTLLQASRVAQGALPPVRSGVPVAALIDRIAQGLAAERRVRHVDFVTHVDLQPAHLVVADQQLLAAALNGAVAATVALVEHLPAARVSIAAGLTTTRQLTLGVSQDHVVPAQAWVDHAFDAAWRDRPGGAMAAVGMLALRQAARVHGGEAAATLSARGSRLTLTIPAGA
jgi:hypothetical protein